MPLAVLIQLTVALLMIPLQVSSFLAVAPTVSAYARNTAFYSTTSLWESPSFPVGSLDATSGEKQVNISVVTEQEAASAESDECLVSLSVDAQELDLSGLADLAPLERQILRMGGLKPYVLVSILTATTSYQTISDLDITGGDSGYTGVIPLELLLATSTLCTVLALYATVVFSLSILYGQTALGLEKEEEYYYMFNQSATQRIRGFQAFSWSLLLFTVDIFLLGIYKLPHTIQLPASLCAAAITYFGYTEYKVLTKGAEQIYVDIFPEPNPRTTRTSKRIRTAAAAAAARGKGTDLVRKTRSGNTKT